MKIVVPNWKKQARKKKRLRNQALKLWKQAVFYKYGIGFDGIICELCGGNWKLIAHHYFYQSTYGFLKFDIDNGIVLCGKCHFKLHHQDPKSVELQIEEKRPKSWLNRLKKKAKNRSTSSYQTISYYQDIIKKLTN